MSSEDNGTEKGLVHDDESSEQTGEAGRGGDQNFQAELERRLGILESPEYDDPARRDLPGLDYLLLAVIIVVTVVAMYWWGY